MKPLNILLTKLLKNSRKSYIIYIFDFFISGSEPKTSDIYESLFKPPVDGYYKFYISSQPQASLYISNISNSTNKHFLHSIAQTVIQTSQWAIFSTAQISSPIFLQKNLFYMLVTIRHNPGIFSHLWTAVEINSPSLNSPYNSTYILLFQLSVSYTLQPEILLVSIFNWTSGTFKIIVNGTDPITKLVHLFNIIFKFIFYQAKKFCFKNQIFLIGTLLH